jgi:GH15 family glucan-1,4-alpha-glucosidase
VTSTPIADYALLSDCQTAALVSRDGSVDWLCLPHFDSRAVFARLLGEEAGHWSIRPRGSFLSRRAYVERSLVLRTEFRAPSGTVAVVDALASGPSADGHDLGSRAEHLLLRVVEGMEGEVEVEVEFAPRPEYGLLRPLLFPVEGGLRCHGGPDTLGLASPVSFDVTDRAKARFTVRAGDRVPFAVQHVPAGRTAPLWPAGEILARLDETVGAWQAWSDEHQVYRGMWQEEVHHSGRVLQALTFRPTGAVVAAPTTSLPEDVGGVRNWDYRFTWVRDAAFTLDALWIAACPDEAVAFFDWMAQAAAVDPEGQPNMQIMFGIRGECDLSERELEHLPGWRGSGPVRVGNAAWRQRQLDVYGELLGAAHRLGPYLADTNPATKCFLSRLADAAAVRWKEPDQGIWEVRSAAQHFVYSKAMCWTALDRAIAMADLLKAGTRVPAWSRARQDIREAIEAQGWNPDLGAYTQAFGSDVLDASVLVLPLVGFTPAGGERMRSTINAIRDRLTDPQGMVYRYKASDDGLPGGEGAFVLCTFWLAQALAVAGEVDEAQSAFERAATAMNDVGLMAEEVDPATGELLGNFPQAFSHIGLINAAWSISQAKQHQWDPARIVEGSAFYRQICMPTPTQP